MTTQGQWISAEDVKCLLDMGKLKMNYEDYWKLYYMQVICWREGVEKLDVIRADLHGKITNDIIKDNNLTNGIYQSVRRGIALLIENDVRDLEE